MKTLSARAIFRPPRAEGPEEAPHRRDPVRYGRCRSQPEPRPRRAEPAAPPLIILAGIVYENDDEPPSPRTRPGLE